MIGLRGRRLAVAIPLLLALAWVTHSRAGSVERRPPVRGMS